MNILNVNMSIDPVTGGGTAERTIQISRSFARAGHGCTILTTSRGLSSEYVRQCEDSGLHIAALPSIWQRHYLPLPSQSLIRKLVADADIVHLMSHWTVINAMVYQALEKLKKPYVVCPAGCLNIFGKYKIIKAFYNFLTGRKIVLNAAGWVAISQNEIDQFQSYGVPESRVSLIPNGINPDDFSGGDEIRFRRQHGIGNARIILFMGRLNPIKGPDILLDAFCRCSRDEQLESYHLVFAGPDEGMLPELKHIVEAFGISDRVHFIGYIGGDEKADAYRAADFLVIPSRQEAMSIVVLEAGITGTPVLITDQCGFNDVVAAEGGMAVEASVEGLQKGLRAMASNPEKLKIMGQNLEKLTRENFLWDEMADRHIALFTQIIRSRSVQYQ